MLFRSAAAQKSELGKSWYIRDASPKDETTIAATHGGVGLMELSVCLEISRGPWILNMMNGL